MAGCNAFGKDGETVKEIFSEISKRNLEALKIISGIEFEELRIGINKNYPASYLVGSCRGILRSPAENGYGLALVQLKSNTAIYVSVLKGDTESFSFQNLSFFNIAFSQSGNIIGRGIEVACESWASLMEIDRDCKKNVKGIVRGSTLMPETRLDSICGTSNEGDMEFLCFQYDPSRRRFVEIGGWYNE
ncbi:hypothetical protein [Pseudoduganella violacea]|uniref:Uncharacterized protein n=1 Tax=Pseudoduganella violacea TaxID=1715466 RepID=A0A7W5B6Y7_9BURK|nr:hypothetical protein [Pseudoduganella violacea]MBB3117558.1 hypothetical protein [Pseudoduganella violacea]